MNYRELFDDFDKDDVCSNIHHQNLNNTNLSKILNCKKKLVSFHNYLKDVIKSIDNNEYNEKIINELCIIIDEYHKNNDDNNLYIFSKHQNNYQNEYETDSQSNSSTKNTDITNSDEENDDEPNKKEIHEKETVKN